MLDARQTDFVARVGEECDEVVNDVLKGVFGVEHGADEAELEDRQALFADHCDEVVVIVKIAVVKG